MATRTRMCMIFIGILCAVPMGGLNGESSPEKRTVTRQEAERLAYEVFDSWGSTKLPKFGLEISPKSIYSGFYTVEATWENPNPGSGIIGHVVVDQRTGDVWDPFSCKFYDSSSLQRLQRQIRKKIGLSEKEYSKLKKAPPC